MLTFLRPPLIDLVLASLLIVVGLLEMAFGSTPEPARLNKLAALIGIAAVAWRQRFPLPVLATTVAGLLGSGSGGPFASFAAVLIASFSTGACRDNRHAFAGLTGALASFWIAFAFDSGAASDFVAVTGLICGAWLVGRLVRDRSRRFEEIASHATRLEREQEERREAAVAEERARIARELHDIVSHSISVITVQTQAVRRRLGADHEREVDDLRAIETVARQAMAEMRRMLGILRVNGAGAELQPQPGLSQIHRLTERMREAGLSIELLVEGKAVPLPPGVDLAAYRVVQEGLTNVLKHARGAKAVVRMTYTDRLLDVIVEDDGPGDSGSQNRGQGLIGMRERVLLYGGEFSSGGKQDGGFHLRARLPIREEA